MVQIPAIVLTQGNHEDIERTGHGCIMNVIAYLQGEAITDHPRGVDEALRMLAVFANDHLEFGPRQTLLIPLVARLMNTETHSWHVLAARMERLIALEREVCGDGTYPMAGFLEYMGPNLPERMESIVRQILLATDRLQMMGRADVLCEAIVRALDDMLPASELTPKQDQDIKDLGAVAQRVKGFTPEYVMQAPVALVAPVFNQMLANSKWNDFAVWVDELSAKLGHSYA